MRDDEEYMFAQLRSFDDEALFFGLMGRFFASPAVRRECGGYPLNDGPRYRWFIALSKGNARVLGFISIEHQDDKIRIRDGYVRAEARQRGLFRRLCQQVLAYVDGLGLACTTRVPQECVPLLASHGFEIHTTRGNWATLKRNAHAAIGTNAGADAASRSPVSGTGPTPSGAAGGGHQPDPAQAV